MTRIILHVLRQAAEPLTTRDIAFQLMQERALNTDDVKFLRLMTKRCGVALRVSGTATWFSRLRGRGSTIRGKFFKTLSCGGELDFTPSGATILSEGLISPEGGTVIKDDPHLGTTEGLMEFRLT